MSQAPIEIDFKSAASGHSKAVSLRTFTSYQFDRNILTPASAFRFTAPGVDQDLRNAIRSGDMAELFVVDSKGKRTQIATGFIDETDTHITHSSLEYVLSGRDTLGQLVDNAAVDSNNKLQNVQQITLDKILALMIANTRIPQGYQFQQIPNSQLLFQTNAGETKINALQRYLDFCNCLVWSRPNGQVMIGKPNFAQKKAGQLRVKSASGSKSNVLEARVRRNLNQAIRKIVTQLQTLTLVNPTPSTVNNNLSELRSRSGVGRSVYSIFSYGAGEDAVNNITQVGNQKGAPNDIGSALSRREIARENMKTLDVEMVVEGHVNESGVPYNIDQLYEVQIDDEDVSQDLYVYHVSYELTIDHGILTRLNLCPKGTIVDGSAVVSGGQ